MPGSVVPLAMFCTNIPNAEKQSPHFRFSDVCPNSWCLFFSHDFSARLPGQSREKHGEERGWKAGEKSQDSRLSHNQVHLFTNLFLEERFTFIFIVENPGCLRPCQCL